MVVVVPTAALMDDRRMPFDAEKFVECLLSEGLQTPCDETEESFNEQNEKVPEFYDEGLYRRGCKFFHDNIFALFYGKLLGLITVLAIPDVLKLLMHTKMSSTPMTAYRRYLSTLFHMVVWYQDDFNPGSMLWKSICEVKGKHNSASKKGCAAGLRRISQKDMALTQFGFMGYALTKRSKVGLHNVKDEDWQAFIHVWRVVGYIMGVQDRFNICRESAEETRAICDILIEKVFRPEVEKGDKDFVAMSTYLVEGMWAMNPTLQIEIYLTIIQELVQPNNNNNNNNLNGQAPQPIAIISIRQKLFLHYMKITLWAMQWSIIRLTLNYLQYLALWLMKVFPFLALYQYGYRNSYVTICSESSKTK